MWHNYSYRQIAYSVRKALALRSYTRIVRIVTCLLICLWCLWMATTAHAEVITLRSGQVLRGEVVLQNEEVLIVRYPDGSRFQYPMTEVVSVTREDAETVAPAEHVANTANNTKKVAMRTAFTGGATYIPFAGWGGNAVLDIQIGTHQLMERHIFVGGGVGVHAMFVNGTSYAFVPVQAVASVPLTETHHAPVVGMAVGYGFAVAGAQKGGICTGVDVGWKYSISDRSALSVNVGVQWQQARIRTTEVIEGNDYTRTMGTNMLSIGVKVGFRF